MVIIKYVMSDLHGMYDKFISMLKQINFNSNDHLYILGDVLDRGDKSLEIIDIDCGACFDNGKLACLRLDDMKEFYI